MTFKQFREVFIDEQKSVKERRAAAGLTTDADPDSDQSDNFPKTGLALSGGGIRSASFGLGFLQAMYERGVLRQVDYLSTVSGGSYVGCFLSSSIADQNEKNKSITVDPSADQTQVADIDDPLEQCADSSRPAKPDERGKEFSSSNSCAYRDQFQSELSLLPKRNTSGISDKPGVSRYQGAYTDDLLRLTKAGETLNRPLPFFNRLFLGMLLINLTAFSGLIAIAALFAMAFRVLNEHSISYVLTELGFTGDLMFPWFPVSLLFISWLVTSYFSRERSLRDVKTEGRWRQINNVVFLLLVASALMAIASLLTVADPWVPVLESQSDGLAATKTRESATHWLSLLSNLAVAGVIAALVPYIRPKALIRSGFDSKSPTTHKWVFNIASRALLFGVPLLVFGLLCQENISGYQEKRQDRYALAPMSIAKWHSFWRRVEQEAIGEEYAPDSFWTEWSNDTNPDKGISKHLWNTVKYKSDPDIEQSIQISAKLSKRSQDFSILKAWNPKVALSLWNPVSFPERVDQRLDNLRWREEFTDLVNRECLADPGLYRYFHLDKNPDGQKRDEAFVRHYERARDLESTAMMYVRNERLKELQGNIDELKTFVSDEDNNGKIEFEKAKEELEQFKELHKKIQNTNWELLPIEDIRAEQLDESPPGPKWGLQDNIDELEEYVSDEDNVADEKKLDEAQNDLARFRRLQDEIQKTNWDLLRSHYGDDIRSYDTIFSYVVLADDQTSRGVIAICFGILFLLFGFLVPLNDISIHRYYRDQLAKVWMNPIGSQRYDARITKVDTIKVGFPYHLINTTLHNFDPTDDPELFIFSPKYCGSHQTGFADTAKYGGFVNYADAMAVSGAAVSPMATRNPLVRVLLFLGNFRLGRWVPNPGLDRESQFPATPLPTMWNTLLRDSRHQRYCFVTDGGVADNTGIASLLHRRCRVIIAVDASQDEQSHFHDLLRLMESQRIALGQTFSGVPFKTSQGVMSTNPDKVPDDGKPPELERIPLDMIQESRSHFVVIQVAYPSDRYADDAGLSGTQIGYIIYIKPSFDGDESAELTQYREVNKDFPHDPTYDQFFDTEKFEKYRGLGRHIGEEVWTHLFKEFAEKNNRPGPDGLSPPWLSHWKPESEPADREAEPEPPTSPGAVPDPTDPSPPAPDLENAQDETEVGGELNAEPQTEDAPAYAFSPENMTLDELRHKLFLPRNSMDYKILLLKHWLDHEDPSIRMQVCSLVGELFEGRYIEDRRRLCLLLIRHTEDNPNEKKDVLEVIVKTLRMPRARQIKQVKTFFEKRDKSKS